MRRCTKIVATIGPSSQDEQTIEMLLQAGMNVARLNFSHGSYENHAEVYLRLRNAASRNNCSVTILQDLQGPKIRTGEIINGIAVIRAGQSLTLTSEPIIGSDKLVSVDYPGLHKSVQPGNRILLDDGNLELIVTDISDQVVETRVVIGGDLKPHKGVNLPGADLDIPGLTQKDIDDLEFGLKLGVDAIAVSFVRRAEDIKSLRDAILRIAPDKRAIPIIAKLERPDALKNLESIVAASDGVMVARGDLGVEMPPESVPTAQKQIIETANRQAKYVITATQMLDSMIHNPRPTRAEASDVANAIFDGTDAVMLSGETAAGKYPVQAVQMMNAISLETEGYMDRWGHWSGPIDHGESHDDTYYITLAARELAHDRNVSAIAIFTKSGRTALLMSKTRPGVPILAFTPDQDTYNRMQMYWGVDPHLVKHANTIEEMIQVVEESILASHPIQPGQQVVLICGFPVYKVRPTNLAILHTLGDSL
jgi:pyruvate kinase